MTNPNEIWLLVPDFPAYEVSDMGQVRYRNGKIKTPQLNKNGYLYVILWKRPAYKAWQIHRLVLSVFTAPRTKEYDACHNNGVRTDNRMENLRWATRKDNEADKIKHGTQAIGDRNGMRRRKLCLIPK